MFTAASAVTATTISATACVPIGGPLDLVLSSVVITLFGALAGFITLMCLFLIAGLIIGDDPIEGVAEKIFTKTCSLLPGQTRVRALEQECRQYLNPPELDADQPCWDTPWLYRDHQYSTVGTDTTWITQAHIVRQNRARQLPPAAVHLLDETVPPALQSAEAFNQAKQHMVQAVRMRDEALFNDAYRTAAAAAEIVANSHQVYQKVLHMETTYNMPSVEKMNKNAHVLPSLPVVENDDVEYSRALLAAAAKMEKIVNQTMLGSPRRTEPSPKR